MKNVTSSFLGTGWAFPPAFNKRNKRVAMVSDAADITESIRIILGTIPGERLMQPTFGCPLNRLVFERINSTLVANLEHMIYHALLDFEPRIKFDGVTVLDRNDFGGLLAVKIDYTIIITNTRHNIVYPFYQIEGTNLSEGVI